MVDETNVTQQRALAAQEANRILGCIQERRTGSPRAGTPPALLAGETPPGVLSHPWAPSIRRTQTCQRKPRGGDRTRGLEPLCCEDGLRAEAAQPDDDKALGRPQRSLSVPRGGSTKDGVRFFPRAGSDRMRGKGFKVRQGI